MSQYVCAGVQIIQPYRARSESAVPQPFTLGLRKTPQHHTIIADHGVSALGSTPHMLCRRFSVASMQNAAKPSSSSVMPPRVNVLTDRLRLQTHMFEIDFVVGNAKVVMQNTIARVAHPFAVPYRRTRQCQPLRCRCRGVLDTLQSHVDRA